MGIFSIIIRAFAPPPPPTVKNTFSKPRPAEPKPTVRTIAKVPVVGTPPAPLAHEDILKGRCYVIDGDTIVIGKKRIRIEGIDAPELDHPWGQKSKWAMVQMCQGQTITAKISGELSYDRLVARCYLPDGRDIAAELVKVGLAIDWPKYSGGRYGGLEPAGIRKKLWRAAARQRGRIH